MNAQRGRRGVASTVVRKLNIEAGAAGLKLGWTGAGEKMPCRAGRRGALLVFGSIALGYGCDGALFNRAVRCEHDLMPVYGVLDGGAGK